MFSIIKAEVSFYAQLFINFILDLFPSFTAEFVLPLLIKTFVAELLECITQSLQKKSKLKKFMKNVL